MDHLCRSVGCSGVNNRDTILTAADNCVDEINVSYETSGSNRSISVYDDPEAINNCNLKTGCRSKTNNTSTLALSTTHSVAHPTINCSKPAMRTSIGSTANHPVTHFLTVTPNASSSPLRRNRSPDYRQRFYQNRCQCVFLPALLLFGMATMGLADPPPLEVPDSFLHGGEEYVESSFVLCSYVQLP